MSSRLTPIRAQQSFPIEMDQMSRRLRDPHLGLPGDLAEKPQKRPPIRERGHEYQPRLGAGEESLQLSHPLRVDRAVAGDGPYLTFSTGCRSRYRASMASHWLVPNVFRSACASGSIW